MAHYVSDSGILPIVSYIVLPIIKIRRGQGNNGHSGKGLQPPRRVETLNIQGKEVMYQAIMLLIAIGIALKITSNTLKSIKKAVDDVRDYQR